MALGADAQSGLPLDSVPSPGQAWNGIPPLVPPEQIYGTHAAHLYNSQAGGVMFSCAGILTPLVTAVAIIVAYTASPQQTPDQIQPSIQSPHQVPVVATPPVASYVARAPDVLDQIAPIIRQSLGYTLPAPPFKAYTASPQTDPTQPPPSWVQALGYTLPAPPFKAYTARPQDDVTQIQAVIRQALGYTLPAPPLRTYSAIAQADPSQPAPQFQAPNYAQQIFTTPPPLVPYVSRGQEDSTTPAPQFQKALGSTLPRPPIAPWVAIGQSDPSQPAPVWSSPNYAPQLITTPPIFAYVARPQEDPSQPAPVITRALGYTLPAPLLHQYTAAPQIDPTQVPPRVQPSLGFTLPVPLLFPYAATPQPDTSIPTAAVYAPNYAQQIAPTPPPIRYALFASQELPQPGAVLFWLPVPTAQVPVVSSPSAYRRIRQQQEGVLPEQRITREQLQKLIDYDQENDDDDDLLLL